MATYCCVHSGGWWGVIPPCQCLPFTIEPLPVETQRKLIEALERNADLLVENHALRDELAALKAAL